MDASGLGVIATAVARLGESDGVLRLRAPLPMTVRILEFTGLSSVVATDGPDPNAELRSALERAVVLPARNEKVDAELAVLV